LNFLKSSSVVAALSLCLAACASQPDVPISEAQLRALVPGGTQAFQVETTFGPAPERRNTADGYQLVYSWTLGRSNTTATSITTGVSPGTIENQRREVVLSFGSDNLLKDIERRTLTSRQGYVTVPPPQ